MNLISHKLSIIVPAYNEATTIQSVLERLDNLKLVHDIEHEIIVVNDASTDTTEQQLQVYTTNRPNTKARIVSQSKNQGKGAAIHRGISLATGSILVIQDADMELVPEEINLLLDSFLEKPNRIVYGSRFLEEKHTKTNYIWHILGNGFLTKLSNIFSGYRLTDMMTCYKMVPTALIQSIHLKENRFGFEPEITMKLAKFKEYHIQEVPITYIARNKDEGKKINWKDGMKVIYCIVKYKFVN